MLQTINRSNADQTNHSKNAAFPYLVIQTPWWFIYCVL